MLLTEEAKLRCVENEWCFVALLNHTLVTYEVLILVLPFKKGLFLDVLSLPDDGALAEWQLLEDGVFNFDLAIGKHPVGSELTDYNCQ